MSNDYVSPSVEPKTICPRQLITASFEIESLGGEIQIYEDPGDEMF